jgi:hypothetical protein
MKQITHPLQMALLASHGPFANFVRISYSLQDDNDVNACIATANAAVGALKDVWHNPILTLQQIFPIPGHPNEPTFMGLQNMVTMAIPF